MLRKGDGEEFHPDILGKFEQLLSNLSYCFAHEWMWKAETVFYAEATAIVPVHTRKLEHFAARIVR